MNDKQLPKVGLEDLDNAPATLDQPREAVPFEEHHKLRERFTAVTERNDQLSEENNKLKRRFQTTQILDELISPYANKAFLFMCSYCGFVALCLVADGFKIWGFDLEPAIMEFLVGRTAVTVIGLVGMVLTGIFVGARK